MSDTFDNEIYTVNPTTAAVTGTFDNDPDGGTGQTLTFEALAWDRRIPDEPTLVREVAAWEQRRNAAVVKVHWQLTTADARIKLARLYPTIEMQ